MYVIQTLQTSPYKLLKILKIHFHNFFYRYLETMFEVKFHNKLDI